MRTKPIVVLILVCLFFASIAYSRITWIPVDGLTLCNDGSYSSSSGSGTCSWHGGVASSPSPFPSEMSLEGANHVSEYLNMDYLNSDSDIPDSSIISSGYNYISSHEQLSWLQYGDYQTYSMQIRNTKGSIIYHAVADGHSFDPGELKLSPGIYTWEVFYMNKYRFFLPIDSEYFHGVFAVPGYVSEYEYVQWENEDPDYVCLSICDLNGNTYNGMESIVCDYDLTSWSPKVYIENTLKIDSCDMSGIEFMWKVNDNIGGLILCP